MLKKLVLGFGLLVASITLSSGAFADATGNWRTAKGTTGASALVKIYKCGSSYCGKIIKVYNADDNSTVGTVIVKGMKRSGKNYKGGTVYAPDNGKTYKGKMKEIGSNKLKVSGCVASILCRSQTWTRR